MPQLVINYHNTEILQEVFQEISENFAEIISLPPEKIFIALNQTPLYQGGKINNDLCMVHIWWKGRPAEVKSTVAQSIGESIKSCGVKKVKVTFLDNQPESIHTI